MENQKVYVAIGCDGKIRCAYGDRASCEKHCEDYSDLFLAEMTIAQANKFYYSDFKGAGIEDYVKAIKELCESKIFYNADKELSCKCPFCVNFLGTECSLTQSDVDVPKDWEINSHED